MNNLVLLAALSAMAVALSVGWLRWRQTGVIIPIAWAEFINAAGRESPPLAPARSPLDKVGVGGFDLHAAFIKSGTTIDITNWSVKICSVAICFLVEKSTNHSIRGRA
jgi:hypothetical protein